MLDSRKSNPRCSFQKEVISYFYNEIEDSDKNKFEMHLSGCSTCSDELAAFASVSSSIQGWRDVELANAPSLEINLTHEEQPKVWTPDTFETRKPRLERLRRLVDLSPVFIKTAAAFGSVAIILGLGWFFIGDSPNENPTTAKKEKPDHEVRKNQVSPEHQEIAKKIDNQVPGNAPGKSVEIKSNLNTSVNTGKSIAANKQSKRNRFPVESRKPSVKKPLVFDELPRLTEEVAVNDGEDELRLTDIFSEVGNYD